MANRRRTQQKMWVNVMLTILKKVKDFFDLEKQRRRDIERYLAQSVDLVDLERRSKEIGF